MNAKCLVLIGFATLIFSTNLFARCNVTSGIFNSSCSTCRQVAYAPACTVNTCPCDTPCQCTDQGVLYNNCIDRCKYCEAFGNIGAR